MISYEIADRILHRCEPLDDMFKLHAQKNYLFDLNDYLGVVTAQGEKAHSFLQGQLTCDVSVLSDIQMVQGAQCNLQGRVLALMDVLQWNGVKLVLPRDLMDATCHSFQKAAMLSRVSFTPSPEYFVFGFYLQQKEDILPEMSFFPTQTHTLTYHTDYCCYHLGKGFYMLLTTLTFGETIRALFAEKKQIKGSLDWHSLRLAQKHFDIYPKTRGLFLPHRLDLQQTPYLSFSKGCYKGQEIIARMHYKATLKHELKVFEITAAEAFQVGEKLMQEGQEVAEVVDYSYLGEGRYLIALSLLKTADLRPHFQTIKEIEVE